MKITKKQVLSLKSSAEDIEQGTITDGTYISFWFKQYFSTYFFKEQKLQGVYIEMGGKKYFNGVCL